MLSDVIRVELGVDTDAADVRCVAVGEGRINRGDILVFGEDRPVLAGLEVEAADSLKGQADVVGVGKVQAKTFAENIRVRVSAREIEVFRTNARADVGREASAGLQPK